MFALTYVLMSRIDRDTKKILPRANGSGELCFRACAMRYTMALMPRALAIAANMAASTLMTVFQVGDMLEFLSLELKVER